MQGIQVGEKIVLDDTLKTDRGPIIKARAVLPPSQEGGAWYGVSIKRHKKLVTGEVFDCYLGDFSDAQRKGKHKGWMEFVNPEDRKRWEAWKAEEARKAKAEKAE